MELKTSTKRFTHTKFDKFKNQTDTNWIDPLLDKLVGKKWGIYFWELSHSGQASSSLGLGLRNVKSPDIDSILIDYRYHSNNWLFLGNGNMIINLDGVDNVTLSPHESEKEVRDGGRIQEIGFWNITKDNLKKVCDAKTISVRISGDTTFFELEGKGLLKFQFMCRSFYADLFDDSSYDQWINSIIPPGSEKSKGACFIATAALGDYDHPVVVDLRIFRDNWLLKRNWGVQFTNWYYTHGPKAANVIEQSQFLKSVTFILIVKPLQLISKLFR